MAESEGRRKIVVAFLLAAMAGLAALFLPSWWQSRNESQAQPETLRSAGAVLPGKVAEARSKIDPGKSEKAVLDLIGKPSVIVETKGVERHTIWRYDYADGNLTLNLTDGYLVRVDTELGPTRRGLKRE
jgi:hypothetical protein